MPDHVHWVFELGGRLTLGRVMAKFKSRTREALAQFGTQWETNYWEHRLRPEDSIEAFGRYVFMNPYRARLIPRDVAWPYGWWPADFSFEFRSALREGGLPPPSMGADEPRPAGWASGNA